jgi:hypothetical protein
MAKPTTQHSFVEGAGTLLTDFKEERNALARGITSIDATQLTFGFADSTRIRENNVIGVTGYQFYPPSGFRGEPLIRDDDNISAYQPIAVQATTDTLQSDELVLVDGSFDLGLGASLRSVTVHWSGLFLLNPAWADTDKGGPDGTWKYASLRMYVGGTEVAIRDGQVRAGRADIFQTFLNNTGNLLELKITMKLPPLAPAEPRSDRLWLRAMPRACVFGANLTIEHRSR